MLFTVMIVLLCCCVELCSVVLSLIREIPCWNMEKSQAKNESGGEEYIIMTPSK